MNAETRCRSVATWMLAILWCAAFSATADSVQRVQIADPYIELHTGAGSGYPIFHVAERGEWIDVLSRKTDWFKVRTVRGKEGWVSRDQLEQTLLPSGERATLKGASLTDFAARRWEAGVLGGDFSGARVITGYGGFALTPNLAAEGSVSHALGEFSSSWLINANLVGQPFPAWRVSPFFTLGMGMIDTKPRVTLVQAQDRSDTLAHVGFGAKTWLTRRFVLRLEYRNYVVFSSNDDNEDIEEWKAGVGVFF